MKRCQLLLDKSTRRVNQPSILRASPVNQVESKRFFFFFLFSVVFFFVRLLLVLLASEHTDRSISSKSRKVISLSPPRRIRVTMPHSTRNEAEPVLTLSLATFTIIEGMDLSDLPSCKPSYRFVLNYCQKRISQLTVLRKSDDFFLTILTEFSHFLLERIDANVYSVINNHLLPPL